MNQTIIKNALLSIYRISPTLKYSPELAKMLSSSGECTHRFIKRYFDEQPSEYIKELAEFESINLDPIPITRSAFIFIPCFNEEKNLESLVTQYMAQEDHNGKLIDKNLYEICFVINFPGDKNETIQKSYMKRFEKSIDILLKKKQEYANIHIITKAFKSDLGSLGRARKYGMDYCLLRILNQPLINPDSTVIISNEGDTLEIPKTYLSEYINIFSDGTPKFVQGRVEYPRNLIEKYEPIRIFTGCREAVHLGQGIFSEQFPFFDGIMPIGRNFGVSPRISVQVGGIDPIRRKDTDDDMNFGTDIHVRLGEKVKFFYPIRLVTNPRREIAIVRDILAGKQQDSKKSYQNFHENRALYDLSYQDVLEMAENHIVRSIDQKTKCELVNQYFQWVLISQYKAKLFHIPGFMDIIEQHRNHQISYWEKELRLCKLFEGYLQSLDVGKCKSIEKHIINDALDWFNYFVAGLNLSYKCTYQGLKSTLR